MLSTLYAITLQPSNSAPSPFLLCCHVNEVILPMLALTGKTSISEHTAIRWLKKLGYTCKDVRKGIYHDGHEHPDVVEARKNFLAQMSQYERWAKFLHVTHQDNDVVTRLVHITGRGNPWVFRQVFLRYRYG
jgi:hypothetical protein